jgi:VanZ family protein
MAVVLFAGAKAIGKVNTLPSLVHKFEHFLYFGTMAGLIAFALGRRYLWIALLTVPLVGLLDEWNQLFVPHRTGSPVDWAVDVGGTVVAVVFVYWWTERRRAVAATA